MLRQKTIGVTVQVPSKISVNGLWSQTIAHTGNILLKKDYNVEEV